MFKKICCVVSIFCSSFLIGMEERRPHLTDDKPHAKLCRPNTPDLYAQEVNSVIQATLKVMSGGETSAPIQLPSNHWTLQFCEKYDELNLQIKEKRTARNKDGLKDLRNRRTTLICKHIEHEWPARQNANPEWPSLSYIKEIARVNDEYYTIKIATKGIFTRNIGIMRLIIMQDDDERSHDATLSCPRLVDTEINETTRLALLGGIAGGLCSLLLTPAIVEWVQKRAGS